MKARFKPIESQNPVYLEAADDELYAKILTEHGGKTYAEVKEDGYRIQVQKRHGRIAAFTRSGNKVNLRQFPELETSLVALPSCSSSSISRRATSSSSRLPTPTASNLSSVSNTRGKMKNYQIKAVLDCLAQQTTYVSANKVATDVDMSWATAKKMTAKKILDYLTD